MKFIIDENDMGEIKIYKEEVPSEAYVDYMLMPYGEIVNKGESDEYILFRTFNLYNLKDYREKE